MLLEARVEVVVEARLHAAALVAAAVVPGTHRGLAIHTDGHTLARTHERDRETHALIVHLSNLAHGGGFAVPSIIAPQAARCSAAAAAAGKRAIESVNDALASERESVLVVALIR